MLYSRFNDTGTRMAWARRDLQQATADVERATAAYTCRTEAVDTAARDLDAAKRSRHGLLRRPDAVAVATTGLRLEQALTARDRATADLDLRVQARSAATERLNCATTDRDETATEVRAHHEWLAGQTVAVTYRDDLAHRITSRRAVLADRPIDQKPPYIARLLGPVPTDQRRLDAWRQAAGLIESYREQWRLDPDDLHA